MVRDGGVFAIAYSAGKVYVGGTFTNVAGNDNADFLAVYDGSMSEWIADPARALDRVLPNPPAPIPSGRG